jgi:hypothetical protein
MNEPLYTKIDREETEITAQANRAYPALGMLIAPTRSAFSVKPHTTQANCVLRFSAETWPHPGQVMLVFCGGTGSSIPPAHWSL